MSKIETIKHSCVICQNNDYIFEYEPQLSPHDEALFVKSISCISCGYPISALEYMESQTGFKYEDLKLRTIN